MKAKAESETRVERKRKKKTIGRRASFEMKAAWAGRRKVPKREMRTIEKELRGKWKEASSSWASLSVLILECWADAW